MGTVGERERVAVVGAGSWGTAFGSITAEKGMDTVLWARREELADVTPEGAQRLPATTHVDGTARVQTVNREEMPLYWRLISAFA